MQWFDMLFIYVGFSPFPVQLLSQLVLLAPLVTGMILKFKAVALQF